MFSVETRPWARCTRVRILAGARDFLLQSPNQFWGPCSLLFIGCPSYFPGVKQLQHEVDYSPLSSADVQNICLYAFMKWAETSPFVLLILFYFIFILVKITVSRCVRYIYDIYIINSNSPAVFIPFL
jgi:hypothetical protein